MAQKKPGLAPGFFDFNDEAFRAFCLWEMAKRLAGLALFALQMLQLRRLVLKQAFWLLLFLLRAWWLRQLSWLELFLPLLLVLVRLFSLVLLALPLLSWRLV
jgi:hypothetical protein